MSEGYELNQENLSKSGFLDLMMWRFIDVIKAILDKIPISQNMSEC